MTIDIATFRTRFPEFDDDEIYTDVMIQLALDDAMLCIDENFWKKFHEIGVMYLAAHELALGKDRMDEEGSFTPTLLSGSETTDKTSYSDAINNIDLDDGKAVLLSTKYGLKHYEYFIKIRPMAVFMVMGGS